MVREKRIMTTALIPQRWCAPHTALTWRKNSAWKPRRGKNGGLSMKDLLKRFDLQLFADGGDPDARDDGREEERTHRIQRADDGDPKETESDDTIRSRRARRSPKMIWTKSFKNAWLVNGNSGNNSWRKERKKAAMSGGRAAQGREKEEAEKRAQEAISKANELLLKAEVKQVVRRAWDCAPRCGVFV